MNQQLWPVSPSFFQKRDIGFLQTSDGREIYFHKHSVLQPGFGHLDVGAKVYFAEEQGERGPQASTVRCVEKIRRTNVRPDPSMPRWLAIG